MYYSLEHLWVKATVYTKALSEYDMVLWIYKIKICLTFKVKNSIKINIKRSIM